MEKSLLNYMTPNNAAGFPISQIDSGTMSQGTEAALQHEIAENGPALLRRCPAAFPGFLCL